MSEQPMKPKEVHERLERARRIAAARLLESMFKECSAEDVLDAFEMVSLWRLAAEGYPFTPMTNARMIEATDE